MNRICVSALALAALAGAANAQVEFQFYERTGQSVASSGDALLEIGVRARVLGGASLGGFNFDIRTDDAESAGTLARARTTVNGAYVSNASAWLASSALGTGGVYGGIAGHYSYLAGINSNFNGLINVSGGTFTNNPAINEIGLVAGAATGGALLGTPGVDTDGDNNPDTAPSDTGNGGSGVPANNEIAPLDPAVAVAFFGQGTFVDLYHFRYTVTNFSARTIHFTLADLGAQTFTQLLYNNGAWGAQNVTVPGGAIIGGGLNIDVIPTPASVALMGLGGLMVARRRRA